MQQWASSAASPLSTACRSNRIAELDYAAGDRPNAKSVRSPFRQEWADHFNEQLAEWYEKALGLHKSERYPGWQEFKMPLGSRFGIDFIKYPSSTVQRQPIVISFLVDDIHKTVEELAAKEKTDGNRKRK